MFSGLLAYAVQEVLDICTSSDIIDDMRATQSYSALLREPSAVVPLLDDGEVVLQRRDAEDLVLSTMTRFVEREEGATLAGMVIADLSEEASDAVRHSLTKRLPWMRWLPVDARDHAIEEILGDLLAGVDTGNLAPFAHAVRSWESTAEIMGDPVLSARLLGKFAGDGAVISRPAVRV
jgi:hypothetical protein